MVVHISVNWNKTKRPYRVKQCFCCFLKRCQIAQVPTDTTHCHRKEKIDRINVKCSTEWIDISPADFTTYLRTWLNPLEVLWFGFSFLQVQPSTELPKQLYFQSTAEWTPPPGPEQLLARNLGWPQLLCSKLSGRKTLWSATGPRRTEYQPHAGQWVVRAPNCGAAWDGTEFWFKPGEGAWSCLAWQWERQLTRSQQTAENLHETFSLLFHSQEWSISNFPCSLTRNITPQSMENLAFHRLLRWKIIILPILITSHIHFFK